jgi:hypothetical protein
MNQTEPLNPPDSFLFVHSLEREERKALIERRNEGGNNRLQGREPSARYEFQHHEENSSESI